LELIAVVKDVECVAFLQWALPRLGRRWEGYRKVRRRVCRRIWQRVDELGLASLADYRRYLEDDPREWPRLDALTDVTISRFYRDRAVFDFVRDEVLPVLVERAREADSGTIRTWSAGCASGEEPYTLAIMWELEIAPTAGATRLQILGTDIKPTVLQRADQARYPPSSMRDLPDPWRQAAFSRADGDLVLKPQFRRDVTFAQHDIRNEPPSGPFDLILCRYQAFTYFDDAGQLDALRALSRVTQPGAVLVLGGRESIPSGEPGFRPLAQRLGVYERSPDISPATSD
jgi:chemotaxis protein methyltransferase CheR